MTPDTTKPCQRCGLPYLEGRLCHASNYTLTCPEPDTLKPEHRCGVRGFAESGDLCPGCLAEGRYGRDTPKPPAPAELARLIADKRDEIKRKNPGVAEWKLAEAGEPPYPEPKPPALAPASAVCTCRYDLPQPFDPACPVHGEPAPASAETLEQLAQRIIEAIPVAVGMVPDPWFDDGPDYRGEPHKTIADILAEVLTDALRRLQSTEQEPSWNELNAHYAKALSLINTLRERAEAAEQKVRDLAQGRG